MDYLSESLKLHYKLRGKLEIQPRAGVMPFLYFRSTL